MTDWLNYYCKFCDKQLEKEDVFHPECGCEEYVAAKKEWLEEYRNSEEHQEPLEPDEYDKKYPQVYLGERLVVDKDGHHKLKLEARKYGEGEGLTVWHPFPFKKEGEEEEDEEGAGLCWDFTDGDAAALYDMLGEYLEKKVDG